jgi:GNAT superfamily N-acetyltransferase
MSGYTIKVASDPDEFDQIHELNYRTFVEEIPQHEANPARRLIDRFHAENTYVVAKQDGRVIGMVCVRERRPFSVDQKIGPFEASLPDGVAAPVHPCEIRLLAIEPGHRRARIILRLLAEIARIALERDCDFAIISGRLANVSLYRALGFRPFGPMTGTAEAPYQPMYASSELFARAQGGGRIVAALPEALAAPIRARSPS